MNALILLIAATIPYGEPVAEHVDVIETNSFYDDEGRPVFDQQIFWDWHPCCERHHVRAWRMVKPAGPCPERDWQRGGWTCLWIDGELIREVRTRSIRRTWTQYDPELIEREILPKESRRELLNFHKP